MKKYKVNDEYSILSSLPYSFQISSKSTSHRLVDHQDDPDAEYPHEITIQMESINKDHILMYTPRKYMRLAWFDDPEESNGSIDMGIRTPDAGLDFASWLTLTGNVPQEVITMAYLIITAPDSVKQYEVPLFADSDNNNSNQNKPPTPPPNNTTKKKRKFKVRAAPKSQRRERNF
jgi:hypothetical protein